MYPYVTAHKSRIRLNFFYSMKNKIVFIFICAFFLTSKAKGNIVLVDPYRQLADEYNSLVVADGIREIYGDTIFYKHVSQIENEIIEKMLEVLKEFRFTNFFHNPATIASQNQPLSGGGCRLLPYPCPRKRFGNVRGKTEKGVCRPHALRQRHPGIHAAVADG